MKHNQAIDKLIGLLSNFSERELLELRIFFQKPSATKAFSKLIDGMIELKQLHSTLSPFGQDAKLKTEKKLDNFQNSKKSDLRSTKGFRPINGFSHRFADILESRSLYPSTKDVVEAVNEAFNWDIKYEDFYKRGRRDLIRHCLNLLGDIEESQRRKMIKSFLKNIRARKDLTDFDRDYRELFSILAGDE